MCTHSLHLKLLLTATHTATMQSNGNNEQLVLFQYVSSSRDAALACACRVICDVICSYIRCYSYCCETAVFLLIQSNTINISNINTLLFFLISLSLSLSLRRTHSHNCMIPPLPLLTPLAYRELAKLSELSIC